jgi:flagellar hook-associated protein 1
MTLFSTLQVAGNSLQAVDIGLQVTGQNIANANTPGYSREVETLTPAPSQQLGSVVLGTGVQVGGVTAEINTYALKALYNATSDQQNAQTQASTYQQVENVLNELSGSGNDLTTSVSNFFAAIQNLQDQPNSTSVRSLAVQSGEILASNINNMSNQAIQMQQSLNSQISSQPGQINQLINQIGKLNGQIVQFQASETAGGDAVGLIDQRNQALTNLSQIIGINVEQQPDGSDNVYVGGQFLVSGSTVQNVASATSTNADGQSVTQLVLAGSQSPLQVTSGTYAGLVNSRDQIVGGFLDQLNGFSATFANEFNKVYASGEGTTGYQNLTSQNGVSNPQVPLENAGLPITPVSGSFQVLVTNSVTGQTQTNSINIDLDGLGQDTTLNGVVSQINNITGLQASVSATGQLTIASQNPNYSFAFANDTSNTLAALGVNTFFTGQTAGTLSVNSDVANDPSKFATSASGVGQDTQNVQILSALNDAPLTTQNGNSLSGLQNQLVQNVTEGSALATAQATGTQAYLQGAQSENQSISGVNLDEETLNMLTLQQTYQASAQLISTVNQLLQLLTQL